MKQEDVQVSSGTNIGGGPKMLLLQASPGKKRSRSINDEEGMAGVELLAQAIDSVIMRVQVGESTSTRKPSICQLVIQNQR